MTQSGKNILIATFVLTAAGGIGYLVYRRKVNSTNSALFMEYIDGLPKINTADARNEIVNTATDLVRYGTDTTDVRNMTKGAPIIFDGTTYKDSKAATAVAAKIAEELHSSMTTLNPLQGGTDMKQFESAFNRIGSKNAIILVNTLYLVTYKESMWEAISGETQLYRGKGIIATLAGAFTNLPKYSPVISKVLSKLK